MLQLWVIIVNDQVIEGEKEMYVLNTLMDRLKKSRGTREKMNQYLINKGTPKQLRWEKKEDKELQDKVS